MHIVHPFLRQFLPPSHLSYHLYLLLCLSSPLHPYLLHPLPIHSPPPLSLLSLYPFSSLTSHPSPPLPRDLLCTLYYTQPVSCTCSTSRPSLLPIRLYQSRRARTTSPGSSLHSTQDPSSLPSSSSSEPGQKSSIYPCWNPPTLRLMLFHPVSETRLS